MRDGSSSRLVPARLALWMLPFREGFTAPTWEHVLVLIVGSILTPGRRTVAAALRVVGLEQTADFTNYHRVLNRNRWSGRWVARCLFRGTGQQSDANRAGRHRPRRHYRATMGSQDQGTRYLSRPGSLFARSFRQGERPAMVTAIA